MYNFFLKRFLDIFMSIIAMPFVIFTIIFIGPIIFITDKGPIFYCSERIGKNGKTFKMFKLRSMRVNAPDIRNSDGSTFNSESDMRVTIIGKFIRMTSLDELPQFINVLKGDMSIIGPRPFVPVAGMKDTSKDFTDRLLVRPGITGYTQAYYRNSISQHEKIRIDAEYANNVSFFIDFKIFIKTIGTVVFKKNIFND